MALYYLAGEYLNLLGRGTVTVSDEDADHPKAYLYDGRPGKRFVFGSNGADRTITLDANLLATSGTSSTCTVRTGERLTLNASAVGAGDTVTVVDAQTGYYLTSAGAWQASAADATTGAQSLSFQVAAGVWPTTTLTVTVTGDTLANVTLYPTVNWCSVHAHNLRPAVAPQLRSSTDGFSGSDTLEATLTIARPSFYGYLSTAVARRYWRLKLSGTNTAAPWLGEVVIGYAETAATAQNYGYQERDVQPSITHVTDGGQTYDYRQSDDVTQVLALPFRWTTAAAMSEVRQEWFRRCRGREQPIVVAPYSGDATVVFGRLDPELAIARQFLAVYDGAVAVIGEPCPLVGA